MNIFYESINNENIRNLITISLIMIFTDVIVGYLKAIKNKKINSSISRDGYIKKIGWVIAIIFGFILDYLLSISLFLKGTSLICITTEGMSIYENLNEIGVKLPFSKYFEKLNRKGDEEDE